MNWLRGGCCDWCVSVAVASFPTCLTLTSLAHPPAMYACIVSFSVPHSFFRLMSLTMLLMTRLAHPSPSKC
ncbi:hypothetical protein B0H19DRAFT_1134172 [Mycena capillaripes]|nr:hypothetical protein B0H19DRAFT_1134172 [Mycena capillaripes]